MNRELKRVSVVVLLMFVALFLSTSILQVGAAGTLNADGRNSRTLNDGYNVQRGPILVAGQPIAQSVPSTDNYKYQRTYPNGPLYSAVTGFYPVNGEPTGIEGAMNSELSGTSDSDFFTRVSDLFTGKAPQGDAVELTIDPKAQQAAYNALGNYKGAVVLLQPKTGRILAMVSKPDFDPNTLAVHDGKQLDANYKALLAAKGDPLINKAITDLNPPGSTFKPIVSSAAFGTGQYTKDSQFPDVASLPLPGSSAVVHNDDFGTCAGGGTVSIGTAQINSCNIPFAELGMKLGSQPIQNQAEKFGFNHQFQIPMKVSMSSYPGYTDQAQLAQSAFGQQSDKATALQMAMVSAGISNNGTVMQPNLVDSVKTSDLRDVPGFTFQPKVFDQAVSPEIAQTEVNLMVQGVNSGVASNARIDGVSVGGKTGTAQNGSDEPYTLWFTGFAPAKDPQFAVAVVVEDGGGLGQTSNGNAIAAPIAQKVLEAVLNK
jgi:penicillin-binding protein A